MNAVRIPRVAATVGAVLAPAACALAQSAGPPEARVPFASVPVALDGRLSAGEWGDAAVVARFWLVGGTRPLEPPTRLYLKHDGGALLVGVRCTEDQPGYPQAFPRRPTDLLTDDDAVQVVLGTADRAVLTREVLNMGGYPGAMGLPVAAADHYYAFTANAVGATSRTYNEGVLERPLFEAAVTRGRRCWSVEMRLPFASAGIGWPTDETVFANLFRFRPPDMVGWHLPAFGGYAPMPFGTLVLLPVGREAERTVEHPRPAARTTADGPPVSAALGWYPLARRVAADVTNPGAAEGAVAVLSVPGVPEKRAAVSPEGRTRLILEIPPDLDLPSSAELAVSAADGGVLCRETRDLVPVERPSWLGTGVAREYVAERVPKPWQPPVVGGRSVELQHSTLTFGPHGLFASVDDGAGELLGGAGEIVLRAGGRDLRLTLVRQELAQRGTSARVDSALRCPGGSVEVRADVDYDGFTVHKLRVRGLAAEQIEALAVQFPLRRENARFVHRMLVQDTRALSGSGWEGPAGPVWLGGHERGLAFNFDTNPFRSERRRSQLQVLERPGATWLRVNLVNGPGQVSDEGHVFRFFLQPTPTKRPSLRKDGLYHTGLWFEEWSDYEGYPDLAKLPQVRERAGRAHAEGKPFILYFNQMLAENAPEFAEYRPELIVPPGSMWYRRAYDPGKGVPCWLCCPRGPYGDLLLDGMARLAEEGDIDGVYMDGTAVAWDCDNPAHGPCAEAAPATWDGEPLTSLVATRSFLKRVRGIFDARGEPVLVAHNGGALTVETLSLCDGFYEGEQLARYRPGYRLPLEKAAVGYCGRPWGFRTDIIGQSYGGRRMMTLAALHDSEVGGDCAELEAQIYADFQDDTVTYYPYWRVQPHVKLLRGEVLCSYYLKPGAAMLVVSNLTWDEQQAVLDVRRLLPGTALQALNVETGEGVPVRGGRVALRLPRWRFAALRITSAVASAPAVPAPVPEHAPPPIGTTTLSRYVAEQWSINTDGAGVSVEPDYDLGDGQQGPRLQSTLYADYATARLSAYSVGPTATIRLRLQGSGRLEVLLGSTTVGCQGSSWWVNGADPWSEGRVFSPEVRPEQGGELVLAVEGGVLDAVYAGQPLARGVLLGSTDEARALALRTWGGDRLAFDVLEVSGRATKLYEEGVQHPVR